MTEQPRRRPGSARPVPRASTPSPGAPGSAAATAVRRIRWLLGIYGLVLGLVIGQLVLIQVVRADEYADRGVRQRARQLELPATRGRIYDRDGDVLATSVPSATIYADPRAYRSTTTDEGVHVPAAGDAAAVAAALAPLLDREPEGLRARLEQDAHFVYLARQLDHEVGTAVLELELPGIGMLVEPRRVYPAGGLAAQVVGFTGIDGEGLQGLEADHDPVLRGTPGRLAFERAPGGLDIASGIRELEPPQVGTDLVLTLDRDIQYLAEQAASDALQATDASGASVIVLDVRTREVLAMASAPGFDPHHRTDDDRDAWRNRAVTDVFEPGSVQKALTIAAAIEEGLVGPHTVLQVPDRIAVGGSTFTDAFPHATEAWSVSEIVERSSNVGTIQVAQALGRERLEGYLRSFGYGRTTGSGLPGEASGLLMPADDWWVTSLPTIAIGQGVAVTLLQLADSYATIANDGVALTPSIVRGSVDEDGRLVPADPAAPRRVVSAETAAAVRGTLEQAVVGDHATGRRAQIAGYRVAGKTGTARKPAEDARGYSDQYVATFVGFAPVDDPQLVVAVMVDEPWPIYGGVVAAPVFRQVMEGALTARRIAPDGRPEALADALDHARTTADDAALQEGPGSDEPATDDG